MKLKTVSKWLVILGALEVGLMGGLNFDLIGSLLGTWPVVIRILYILILVCAVWGIFAMAVGKKK